MNVRWAIASIGLMALAACSSGSDGKPTPPVPLPPPTMEHISPGAGISGVPFAVEVYGSYFRDPAILGRSDRDGPTFVYSRIRDLDRNVVDGPGASGVAVVESASSGAAIASFTMDASALPAGVYSLSLRTIGGLEVRRDDAFIVLPRPAVTSIDHSLFCDPHMARFGPPRSEMLGINGTNLYRLPPSQLALDLVARSPNHLLRPSIVPESISGCRPVPFSGGESCFNSQLGLICDRFQAVELCTRIEARMPTDIDLSGHMVVAAVPPLLGRMAPDATFDLFADIFIEEPAPMPSHGLFSAVEGAVAMPLWVGGRPLVVGPSAAPVVRIDGAPFPTTATDCAPSGASGVDLCRGLTAVLPQGFPPGEHSIDLTTATGCVGSTTFRTVPRPVIQTVTPATICERGSQTVFLNGDGFVAPDVFIDGKYDPLASGCVPTPGNSSCLSLNLGRGDLSLGAHVLEVENRSTPLIRSGRATLNVVTGPPLRGRPSPTLVYSSGSRKVFVPVVNVTGHVLSARLIAFATAIAVEVVEVPGGIELTVPASAGRGAYLIEVSDESPCPGGDPGSSFLSTTDVPIVRSLDFDAQNGALLARTLTVAEEPGPAVTWLENQGATGSAIGASREASGPDWYFALDTAWEGDLDLGLLRLDLRAQGAGDPAAAPGVLLTNFVFRLEHAIPPPPPDGSWAHYEVSLENPDGWTYRDATASRPATPADLRSSFVNVRVLGSWQAGAGNASLDNVVVELAR
jgi:hypothetical protein